MPDKPNHTQEQAGRQSTASLQQARQRISPPAQFFAKRAWVQVNLADQHRYNQIPRSTSKGGRATAQGRGTKAEDGDANQHKEIPLDAKTPTYKPAKQCAQTGKPFRTDCDND